MLLFFVFVFFFLNGVSNSFSPLAQHAMIDEKISPHDADIGIPIISAK